MERRRDRELSSARVAFGALAVRLRVHKTPRGVVSAVHRCHGHVTDFVSALFVCWYGGPALLQSGIETLINYSSHYSAVYFVNQPGVCVLVVVHLQVVTV